MTKRVWILGVCIALVTFFGAATACDKTPPPKTPAELIGEDPLVLLPAGPLGYLRIDGASLFASPATAPLTQAIQERIPVPPAMGWVPSRDLRELHVGFYSLQGVDFVALALGRFPPLPPSETVANDPRIVVEQYAGHVVFLTREQDSVVVDRLAFSVLSPGLALFGNETAVRRALDRIADNRLKRDIPPLMAQVAADRSAAMAAALELSGMPAGALASSKIPLLPGLVRAAAVGNFQPPGLNIAATLTYDHPQTATNAAGYLSSGSAWLGVMAPWAAVMGMAQPIQKLDARAQGNDLMIVAGLDPRGITEIMRLMGGTFGWSQ